VHVTFGSTYSPRILIIRVSGLIKANRASFYNRATVQIHPKKLRNQYGHT
jgi:hypothetical protein